MPRTALVTVTLPGFWPPHRHAEMVGLHGHDGAPRSQLFVQGVGDLRRQALLELGPTGIAFHHPGQFGEARDPLVRYVTHVGLANERQGMVFTRRGQRYVPDEDHPAAVFLESHARAPGSVLTQPCEEQPVGLGDAPGCAPQAFSFRVLPYGCQYLPDSTLDPRPVYPLFRGIEPVQPFEASPSQLHGKGELLVGCSSPVS